MSGRRVNKYKNGRRGYIVPVIGGILLLILVAVGISLTQRPNPAPVNTPLVVTMDDPADLRVNSLEKLLVDWSGGVVSGKPDYKQFVSGLVVVDVTGKQRYNQLDEQAIEAYISWVYSKADLASTTPGVTDWRTFPIQGNYRLLYLMPSQFSVMGYAGYHQGVSIYGGTLENGAEVVKAWAVMDEATLATELGQMHLHFKPAEIQESVNNTIGTMHANRVLGMSNPEVDGGNVQGVNLPPNQIMMAEYQTMPSETFIRK